MRDDSNLYRSLICASSVIAHDRGLYLCTVRIFHACILVAYHTLYSFCVHDG